MFPNAGLEGRSNNRGVHQDLPPEQTNESAAGGKNGSTALERNGTGWNSTERIAPVS
jgi:hypothetical protein